MISLFTKAKIQMAIKHMKTLLASLASRVMHITTTNRFHYTPTRMAKVKRSDNIKCGQECRATEFPSIASESANCYNYSGKLFGNYLPKINMHLCYDTAIPFPTEMSA